MNSQEMKRQSRFGGRHVGSAYTRDAAFTYRMGAGFPGMISRHFYQVEVALQDSSHPLTAFGMAAIADASSTNGVRIPATGDSGVTTIWGISFRTYPFQQVTTSTNYGGIALGVNGAPASTGPIDIMTQGYMIVTCQGAAAATKGGSVYLCVVAGTGYAAGLFSTDTVSGTFTSALTDAFWNGPADANGLAEIRFNI
jgi:hypothetical protein